MDSAEIERQLADKLGEMQRARRSAQFGKMDEDGDQSVSLAEFKAFKERQAERFFKARDGDEDGQLSREEWVNPGPLRPLRGPGGAPPSE